MIHCPICGYDLRASLTDDGAHCPECGRRYTRRDVEVLGREDDSGGEPATLSPREKRMPGWLLLVILGAIVGGVVWLLSGP